MLLVFLVIVLDLIGFGIMVPILAYYVVQLGGGPELATFCMALYAIGMFISTRCWVVSAIIAGAPS